MKCNILEVAASSKSIPTLVVSMENQVRTPRTQLKSPRTEVKKRDFGDATWNSMLVALLLRTAARVVPPQPRPHPIPTFSSLSLLLFHGNGSKMRAFVLFWRTVRFLSGYLMIWSQFERYIDSDCISQHSRIPRPILMS